MECSGKPIGNGEGYFLFTSKKLVEVKKSHSLAEKLLGYRWSGSGFGGVRVGLSFISCKVARKKKEGNMEGNRKLREFFIWCYFFISVN